MDKKQALHVLRQTALNHAACYEDWTAEYKAWKAAADAIDRLPIYEAADNLAIFVSGHFHDLDMPEVYSDDPLHDEFQKLEKAYCRSRRTSAA